MFGNLDVRDRVSCDETAEVERWEETILQTAEEYTEWLSHLLEAENRFFLDTENLPQEVVDLIFGNDCPEDLPF